MKWKRFRHRLFVEKLSVFGNGTIQQFFVEPNFNKSDFATLFRELQFFMSRFGFLYRVWNVNFHLNLNNFCELCTYQWRICRGKTHWTPWKSENISSRPFSLTKPYCQMVKDGEISVELFFDEWNNAMIWTSKWRKCNFDRTLGQV